MRAEVESVENVLGWYFLLVRSGIDITSGAITDGTGGPRDDFPLVEDRDEETPREVGLLGDTFDLPEGRKLLWAESPFDEITLVGRK
jgi:hypothetical protein